MTWPTTCAEVTFEMGNLGHERVLTSEAKIGDLLWDAKGGEGHVLVGQAQCQQPMGVGRHPYRIADCGCGGWLGLCPALTLVCECGEDSSWRDHHYRMLARRPST